MKHFSFFPNAFSFYYNFFFHIFYYTWQYFTSLSSLLWCQKQCLAPLKYQKLAQSSAKIRLPVRSCSLYACLFPVLVSLWHFSFLLAINDDKLFIAVVSLRSRNGNLNRLLCLRVEWRSVSFDELQTLNNNNKQQ